MARMPAIALLIFCLLLPTGAFAEKRIALVIGTNRYVNLPPRAQLQRAVNDARAISKAFRELGFDATILEDASRATFNAQWQQFLGAVGKGDIVAFYFAGHGVEIEGQNFLIPKDIPLIEFGRQEQIKRESISVSDLLLDLKKRNPGVSLFIFDACREHPLIPDEWRSTEALPGGLAKVDAPVGTFIMYSAWAGQTALDSLPPPMTDPDPVNSIYTRKLLPLMRKNNLQLRDLAAQVRDEVHALAATAHHPQTPAYYDGVLGKFCLGGCDLGSETAAGKQDELEAMRKRVAAFEAAAQQAQEKQKGEQSATVPLTDAAPKPAPVVRDEAEERRRDDEAWQEAQVAATAKAMARYLWAWRNGKHSVEASAKRETLCAERWPDAKRKSDWAALSTFIEGACYETKSSIEAGKLRAVIDETAWRHAKTQNTADALIAYLRKTGGIDSCIDSISFGPLSFLRGSSCVDESIFERTKAGVAFLSIPFSHVSGSDGKYAVEAEAEISDFKAWADAEHKNTSTSYRDYLSGHSKGRFKPLAEKLQDDRAWAEALKSSDYQGYIDNFPSGRHLAEAKQKLRSQPLPHVAPDSRVPPDPATAIEPHSLGSVPSRPGEPPVAY